MRNPRQRSESDIYHVIGRGAGKQLIFEDDYDRARFLSIMAAAMGKTTIELFAWCLMGNHFHLLVHAPIERVSAFMRTLNGEYARRFNKRHGRSGHLFQERFRSEPVDSDEYLMTVVRYIHQNPDKALIGRFDTFMWSSYSEFVGTQQYCSTGFVLDLFGSVDEFINMHRIQVPWNGCMELGKRLRPASTLDDDAVLEIARIALGEIKPSDVKTFERNTRNRLLRQLKDAGLSARHIERITGISKSVISRA